MIEEEEMIEFSVRLLLSGRCEARNLVLPLVLRWPNARVQELVYVMAVTAGTVEHMLADPEISRVAQDVWRVAGLVSVDIYIAKLLGLPFETAADLTAYWQRYDRFFLDPS